MASQLFLYLFYPDRVYEFEGSLHIAVRFRTRKTLPPAATLVIVGPDSY
ncbi:MAG: hypothetical protein MK102_06985 [Fuerstiella sp.]|nr:hypothetical protein [Fuerstiella sp.]